MNRLTNTIRDAFIRAAMNDVPSVDYTDQIRASVMADIVGQLPPKVRAVYDDAVLRHWIKHDWNCYGGVSITHPSTDHSKATLTPAVAAKVAELKNAHDEQQRQRSELERKLRACAYSVNTRKALVNLLPEFEKYLPADEPAALRTLPAVANVVADFVKAGWSPVSTN